MAYSFEVLSGIPAGANIYQFGESSSHPEGSVIKVVVEESRMWIGNFQPGVGTLSRVCEPPNANTICVVARGKAYLVDVKDPTDVEIISSGLTPLGLSMANRTREKFQKYRRKTDLQE